MLDIIVNYLSQPLGTQTWTMRDVFASIFNKCLLHHNFPAKIPEFASLI